MLKNDPQKARAREHFRVLSFTLYVTFAVVLDEIYKEIVHNVFVDHTVQYSI